MDRFFRWMKELKNRRGKLTGTISLWLKGEEETLSYTLLLSELGVEVKEPGLKTADLVLSMREELFQSWLEGTLDPASIPPGALAWDGDIRLFRELGYRMSHAPMLPHQSLIQQHMNEE